MIKEENSVVNEGINSGAIIGNNLGTVNIHVNRQIKQRSIICDIVQILGEQVGYQEIPNIFDMSEYNIEEKIEYNGLVRYSEIIKENSILYHICENTLNSYDDLNFGAKNKILWCIRNWYLDAKGKVLQENIEPEKKDIEIIKNKSDLIMETIIEKVKSMVLTSLKEDILLEDLDLGIIGFITYCFVECKILEKPV